MVARPPPTANRPVLKNSKNSKEAKEFLEFLKGDECKAIFEKVGFTRAK